MMEVVFQEDVSDDAEQMYSGDWKRTDLLREYLKAGIIQ